MSSTGQVQIGSEGADMASPNESTSLPNDTVAQEVVETASTPGSSSSPPTRPVVPPRGSFSPSIKRSASTQNIAPPQPPSRPSQPKFPPTDAPKKSPPPRAPGSTDLPLSPGLKKARPPSIHAGRPLPVPNADASSSSEHFSAALASTTPPPTSSSPTLPSSVPPATNSNPNSAPNSDSLVSVSRGPSTTSPGIKRPLSFVNQSPTGANPGSPKVGMRPVSSAPKSSPALPVGQAPQMPPKAYTPPPGASSTSPDSQAPVIPPKPNAKTTVAPPKANGGATPPGSLGKMPIAKVPPGSPKSSLPAPPAPLSAAVASAPSFERAPSPVLRRTPSMVAPTRAAPLPPQLGGSPSPSSSPSAVGSGLDSQDSNSRDNEQSHNNATIASTLSTTANVDSAVSQDASNPTSPEKDPISPRGRISPRTVPRGSPPPPIAVSAATPRTEDSTHSGSTPRQSPPSGVSPLTLAAPTTSGATTPNGPLSPHSNATSPRQEGFTSGFVKPSGAKRAAGIAFGSRARNTTSDQPPSPRSAGEQATSMPPSPRTAEAGTPPAELPPVPTPSASTGVVTAVTTVDVADPPVTAATAGETSTAASDTSSTTDQSLQSQDNAATATTTTTVAAPSRYDDVAFNGEGTMPPPPPEDDGGDPLAYDKSNSLNDGDEESSGTQSSSYTPVLDYVATAGAPPSGTFSLLTVLGREDQTGPPPPGLTPLPGIFHPVRAPPALPAGVVHPDVLAAQQAAAAAAAAEQPQDEKKKKKGFGSLFGVKDKDSKDAKDKDKESKEKDKESKEKEKAEKEREKQLEKEKKEREKKEKEEKERREKEEKKAAAAAAADEKAGLKGLKKILGGGAPDSGRLTHSSSNGNLAVGAASQQALMSEFGPSPIKDKLDLYSRLMELLCRPDLHLLNITASLVKRGDVDKQSRAWVHLLTPRGRMVDLLGKVIYTEVDKTDHEGTLFRNNTFSVGLMSAFAHEVGRPYLKNLLGPLLTQILTSGLSYEINPEKSESGPLDEDTVDANTMNLLEACGAYVDAIVKSLPDVPVELRRVCTMLRQYVSTKFPASVNTCVGGFFFLRFLTPAVVSPEGFGVQDENDPISIEMRRPLILISKTLQQISNEMYFSEDHMMSLNSFITENIPAFQQFFQDICSPTAEDPAPPQFVPYTHESNRSRDDALLRLHAFLAKSLPEIKAVAQVEPAPPGMTYDPISELEKILTDLGEPQDPKILKAPAPAAATAPAAVDTKKKK